MMLLLSGPWPAEVSRALDAQPEAQSHLPVLHPPRLLRLAAEVGSGGATLKHAVAMGKAYGSSTWKRQT